MFGKNLIKFRTKFRLIENLGVDTIFQIPFTEEFSNLSARFFIENILIKSINVNTIFVGKILNLVKKEGDTVLLNEYKKNKFNLKYFKKG